MDYEKKYNEALKWMRELYPGLHGATKEDAEHYFPELSESEDDEKIRTLLVCLVKWAKNFNQSGLTPNTVNKMLSYLEKQKEYHIPWYDYQKSKETGYTIVPNEEYEQLIKQKERKPEEWSEDEKQKLNRIYAILGQAADTHAFSTTCRLIGDKEAVELQDFIRSIAKPQAHEWSEEDERMARFYENDYDNNLGNMPMCEVIENRIKFKDWVLNKLKSLRPQPHWKPSEEQMKALAWYSGNYDIAPTGDKAIKSLYNDLKKLM